MKIKDNLRCSFCVVANECTPEQFVIKDKDEGMSVTNDIENVVLKLLKNKWIHPGKRLFYYDTIGRRDEILFDKKGFVDFCVG